MSHSAEGSSAAASATRDQSPDASIDSGDTVGHVLGSRPLGGEPSHRFETSRFASTLLRDETGGDAIQPWGGVGTTRVVRLAPLERDAEDLADQVVGLRADTTDEVTEDHAGMTVEELGEASGLGK